MKKVKAVLLMTIIALGLAGAAWAAQGDCCQSGACCPSCPHCKK
jgi:hypothetical protein